MARTVQLVDRKRGWYVYALDDIRGSTSHYTQRWWAWRTWPVVGGMTLDRGDCRTMREAKAMLFRSMRNAAGKPDREG